jgi:cytochrome P450
MCANQLLSFLFSIRRISKSVSVLRSFMQKQVDERRQEIRAEIAAGDSQGGRQDVFSMLVRANESEGERKLRLDDSDLVSVAISTYFFTNNLRHVQIGNVFILLFAGHGESSPTN